jgi:signal peptide peptidase SppA
MIRSLPHIFSRAFNCPLAITPSRMEPLIAGLRAATMARSRRANGDEDEDEAEDYPEPPDRVFQLEDETWARRESYRVSSGGVAWITVRDVLVKREGRVDADSSEFDSYSRIGRVVRSAIGDPTVTGIILDIDSCGGESAGLFDLCDDIHAAGTVKPIWAVSNDNALSAAYAIASAAERIWITRTGTVGSIGVVALHTDQSAFDDDEGVAYDFVYSGAHKVDFNPHAPLTDGARDALQAECDRLYGIFVGQVAAYRGMPAAKVAATEAALYSGEQAIAAGLADEIGTLADAVAAMTGQQGDSSMETIDAPPAPVPVQETVVRIDHVRAATANVRRDNVEIVNLCAIAGMPQLAGEFIGKETSVSAVRAELLRRQTEADDARQVETIDTTRVKPPGPAAPSEMAAVINRRWAAQMGKGA